jgi:hypothetical protein
MSKKLKKYLLPVKQKSEKKGGKKKCDFVNRKMQANSTNGILENSKNGGQKWQNH